MLNMSDSFKEAMNSPVREFAAEVQLQEDETNLSNLSSFTHLDRIKNIEIQRIGDKTKFWGYGICQRINLSLVDLIDEVKPVSKSSIKAKIGIKLNDDSFDFVSYPTFYLTEKNRKEEEGEISLTGYDKIYNAANHTTLELSLTQPYTIKQFIEACGSILNCEVVYEGFAEEDYFLNLSYENGANLDGTETIREALDYAAEATQSIYFIDYDDKLRFKRLDISGEPVATITPEDYFTFSHSDNRRLVGVCHVTELGDNVIAQDDITGTIQYIRNNPFYELRDDIGEIISQAYSMANGLTVSQYECTWRGFPLLEIGDKIELQQVEKEGYIANSFVLDDVITYDGGFTQKTQWNYEGSDTETEATPSTVGEAIKSTYAKVDKINKEITLHASQIEGNSSELSALLINTGEINATVQKIEAETRESIDGLTEEVELLKRQVSLGITADDVQIQIKDTLENGVNKVETTTGFTFDDTGLNIKKTDSEMSTQITEDGMTVYKNDEEMLVANNKGVKAANLHATTYLIIGRYTRFEDYSRDGEPRTGAFWIGEA